MSGDAVGNAANSLMRGSAMVTGSEMLQEVLDRRFEQRQQEEQKDEQGSQQQQQPNFGDDIASIRAEMANLSRINQELANRLSRAEGAYQTLWASQQNQRQQTQEVLPTVETDDPDLLAALNTFEQRFDKKLQQSLGALKQSQENQARSIEYGRFQAAVNELAKQHPDFLQLYPMEELKRFAAPYINNPQYHGYVDWNKEFALAYKSAKYDAVASQLAAAQKQLEEYKGKQASIRESQKANLKLVPGIGRGSGGSSGGSRPLGDQIIADWRAKNGKKPMPMKGFGRELLKRINA
jgi:hypothetical protein